MEEGRKLNEGLQYKCCVFVLLSFILTMPQIVSKKILAEIKRTQADVYSKVTISLGLPPDQIENFQEILEHAIGFFDKSLGLELDKEN